jgi:hypothetical protein
MKRTKRRLSKYWDEIILRAIPPYGKFKKMEGEIKEHFTFVSWMFKRIVLPLIVFYVIVSLMLNINIFGPLFIMLLLFLYSNFLPDTDFLIKKTRDKKKESLWYEKYSLLFFAPVIMYYIIAGRARPLYSTEERCFHNFRTAVIYGIFLFIVGCIFWSETIKRVMLPLFGVLGFIFHLMVDKRLKANPSPDGLKNSKVKNQD